MDSVKRQLFQTPSKRKASTSGTPLSKKQKQAVAQIAKKVVLRTTETKSAANYNQLTPVGGDTVQCQNLNHFMSQGVTDLTYTGTDIYMQDITINLTMTRRGSQNLAGTYNDPVTARVLIFKTKQALTNTTAAITYSDLFRSDGTISNRAQIVFPDKDKVQLLVDRKYNMSSLTAVNVTGASPSNTKTVTIKVPIKRKKTWDGDNSGYFKDGNYYMAVVYNDIVGIPSYVQFTYNWTVNFKDI